MRPANLLMPFCTAFEFVEKTITGARRSTTVLGFSITVPLKLSVFFAPRELTTVSASALALVSTSISSTRLVPLKR